jgi:pentatricopeptide repeat protein
MASLSVLAVLLLIASSSAFSPQWGGSHISLAKDDLISSFSRTMVASAPPDQNDAAVSTSTNHTAKDDDDVVDDDQMMIIPKNKSKLFSKVKWKKKRYLMMQDVKKKIREKDPSAPRKAEEMVRRMFQQYENSGRDMDFRPSLQAYNLWIHALAKSSSKSSAENAGELAEKVLEQMRDHQIWPDVITYTSVMDAHARSQNPEKAEDVLFRLLDEAPTTDHMELTSVTCDTILNAWAQQGTREGAERAQMILFRLEEWQRNDIRPTKISYSTGT